MAWTGRLMTKWQLQTNRLVAGLTLQRPSARCCRHFVRIHVLLNLVSRLCRHPWSQKQRNAEREGLRDRGVGVVTYGLPISVRSPAHPPKCFTVFAWMFAPPTRTDSNTDSPPGRKLGVGHIREVHCESTNALFINSYVDQEMAMEGV